VPTLLLLLPLLDAYHCATLQAPKLPNAADMNIAKRLFKKYNHSSSVCIGLPGNKDPQQFKVGRAAAAIIDCVAYTILPCVMYRVAAQLPA
jgi:hypothetical protein